jgi:hypothetical protein
MLLLSLLPTVRDTINAKGSTPQNFQGSWACTPNKVLNPAWRSRLLGIRKTRPGGERSALAVTEVKDWVYFTPDPGSRVNIPSNCAS